jgi:tRNA threonylcarbamoyladenosine biosynthesis protein TsaE
MERITKSAAETQKLAHELASTLKEDGTKRNVIALIGDLGSGKTTFVQGLAKSLGIVVRLVSPTFILMRRYQMKKGMLYHLDAYRIDQNVQEEVENLGLSEIWDDKENIVVIEWAEKIQKFLPKDTIWINFEYVDENERKVTLSI